MADVTILADGLASVQSAGEAGLEALADWIVVEAQRRAPVGTAAERDFTPGTFRDSIHKVVDGDTVSVISDSDHSVYVELGTSRMRAEPTLTPALQAGMSHLDEIVGGAMVERLR